MQLTKHLLLLLTALVIEAKPPTARHRQGDEYCLSTDPAPYRNFCTKTPYDLMRNQDEPKDEGIPGCKPIQMFWVARHGSRYSSADTMEDIANYLQSIHDHVITGNNLLCEADLEYLASWQPLLLPDRGTALADRGWREFRNLGERFKVRVPELLDQPYDPDFYVLRHSNYTGRNDRTRDTARAFSEGVWGTYEGVEMIESGDPDWLIKYYSSCDKYKETVDDVPAEEREKFNAGSQMTELFRRVERRLGLAEGDFNFDRLDLLYDSCRVEYNVREGVSPWCVALTPEDLKVMEYSEDLRYYWTKSYPIEINYEQACPLIEDLVNYFTDSINGNTPVRLAAAFGHSTTLNTFYTRLGLFQDLTPLRADDYPNEERQWRVSVNTPKGANVAFLLYECGDDPQYRVKTFVNEFPVVLPQCEDYVCDWEVLKAVWEPIADGCNIEEICRWPEES